MDETPYVETLEPGEAGDSPDGAGGSKLPPVLANLMGSMGAGKSPQGPGGGGINVQEILTSIMVRALLPLSTFSEASSVFAPAVLISPVNGNSTLGTVALCSPGALLTLLHRVARIVIPQRSC